jgi:quercetin dioxygenase-like cupin family protein
MVVHRKSAKVSEPFPGVRRRIMANSDKLMLTEHTLENGAVLPEHNHPHEQLVYLISGEIVVEMGGEKFKVAKGDSLVIPSEVNHKVTASKQAVALDIFTPSRLDYL